MLFQNKYNIPEKIILWILAVCLLPIVLNIVGVHFGLVINNLSVSQVLKHFEFERQEGIVDILRSRQIHTIFVSASIAIAFLTVILAFIDFRIRGEVSTPIVGVALFCSGMLQAFHVLISTRILDMALQQYYITSFTWFFSRLFHPLILIIGTGIFLIKWNAVKESVRSNSRRFVNYISVVFVSLTLVTIVVSFFGKNISDVHYPLRQFARGYDLIPLALYLIAGLYVLPKFYDRFPSVFAQTLLLSMIPGVATQLYMAFGSDELFDNAFNISHLTSAITYFIPFLGLGMNYLQAHRNEKRVIEELNREAAIRISVEQNLTSVLNSSLSGIAAFRAIRNPSGQIIDFQWTLGNPSIKDVFGIESKGIEGKHFLETMPDAKEEGLFQMLKHVVETGEQLNKEHYSERQKKWFLFFGTKLHDGVTVTISDISKSKEASMELMKAEKLAVAGRIARTIAHEVRNPLTNINLAVEQLKNELDALRDENGLYLDIVKRNSDRINQLITELMNSSKPAEMKLASCSVNQLLDDTLNWAVDRIQLKSVQLVKDYSSERLFIQADIEKLKTALLNIIINAIEAIEENKGVLTIRSLARENKCVIEIEDNGQGISQENLDKLFDPFFSIKEKGMGLGLTATQNIIKTHEGSIEVKSKIGKGTCFTLTFNKV